MRLTINVHVRDTGRSASRAARMVPMRSCAVHTLSGNPAHEWASMSGGALVLCQLT